MKFPMCLQLPLGIQALTAWRSSALPHPLLPWSSPWAPPFWEMGRPEAHTGFKTPGHHEFTQQPNNIYQPVLNAFPEGSHCSAQLWPQLIFSVSLLWMVMANLKHLCMYLFFSPQGKGTLYSDPLFCLNTLWKQLTIVPIWISLRWVHWAVKKF